MLTSSTLQPLIFLPTLSLSLDTLPMPGTTNLSNSLVSNDTPTKCTSPKGDFGGHQYAFLEQHLKEYYEKVKSVATHSWWLVLYSEYWSHFDWWNHTNIILNEPIDKDTFGTNNTISHQDAHLFSDCKKELKAKTMKVVNTVSLILTHHLSDLLIYH